MTEKTYYYVPCYGGPNVNQEFAHYFRLYVDKGDGRPLLVDQGLVDKLDGWIAKYPGVTINVNNPYPQLD